MGRTHVTITIERDDVEGSRTVRFPLWAVRLAAFLAIICGILLLLGLAVYGPVVRAAARVPGLERDIARLEAETQRVRELAAAVDSLDARYAQLRRMVGADIVRDPVALSGALPVAPAVRAAVPGIGPRYEEGPSLPSHWPVDEPGYVTRGMVSADASEEPHSGIDIAVAPGTPVRAAGGGTVAEARADREYGLFVRLVHPDGYETIYGHLSRLLVEPGERLSAGTVIGLSGNTGRSSAPHLHFEVRRGDQSVDPSTLVKP